MTACSPTANCECESALQISSSARVVAVADGASAVAAAEEAALGAAGGGVSDALIAFAVGITVGVVVEGAVGERAVNVGETLDSVRRSAVGAMA